MTVSNVNLNNLNLNKLENSDSAKKEKLKKACDEFVSIMYQQMFETMESAMKVDGAMNEDTSGQTDYAKYLFNKTMSKEVIKRDDNNLAELLYAQMLEKSGLK